MGRVWTGYFAHSGAFTRGGNDRLASLAWARDACLPYTTALGGLMWGWDLGFIGMTIGAFLVLWLLVKGVELFER
jgi:hypothetical protein